MKKFIAYYGLAFVIWVSIAILGWAISSSTGLESYLYKSNYSLYNDILFIWFFSFPIFLIIRFTLWAIRTLKQMD